MKKILALVMALCMLLSCTAMAETEVAEDTYTYNSYLTAFPTNWNPHQYKTATDSDAVLSWITSSLYTFDYNETYDSYAQEAVMAAAEPVDVTADYVGEEWGIAEGETGRAWKMTLHDNIQWQDGTPITAETYVESVKLQLNPKAQNYRADSLYSGGFRMVGAEAYVKQGTNADTMLSTYADLLGVETIDEVIAAIGDQPGYINWSYSFGDTYDFATGAWTGSAANEIVDSGKTLKELYDFYITIGDEYATWADQAGMIAYAADELYAKYTYPEVSFDTVGIKALSPTEVVFIMDNSLEGFYLKYYLDITLVHPELYKACETYDEATGVYTNTYGTSVETTISYGPYILETFQLDKEIVLAKNPNWFGWSLPEYENTYQTTHVKYVKVENTATAMEMFLAGQLDTMGLNADYIREYINSDYCYFSEGASVFAMVFNPDMEALTANQAAAGENINKTMLTVKEFRQAMALGMDRAAFILATSPSGVPAFALYGDLIIADPETGTTYRSTDAAKKTIVEFWGVADEIGEGKLYATVDEAIDSITGYSPELAKEFFNQAYDKAIAEGLMDEDDVVEIIIGLPSTSTTYLNGYDFIVNNYTELAKGTKMEGKITFKKDDTVGNSFGDSLCNNQTDMLFYVGWSGSAFDPYNLFQVYVDSAYQYDPAWDSTQTDVTIELDGVPYTASAKDWFYIMNGVEKEVTVPAGTELALAVGTMTLAADLKTTLSLPYSTDPAEAAKRMTALGVMEGIILQNYNYIPLAGDASASLKGMQIEYFMEDEVYPLGRGGTKYMTYNYTDAEWDAFVTEQGGILNYK
ncbi:MAG: hypothetical protein IJZ74_03355 [Clostridia bacterium]|nr:hypothetical protein [Clostridia bacterium]